MNETDKYLFDLQGYLVLEKAVPASLVTACNEVLDRFEQMPASDYPPLIPVPARAGDAIIFTEALTHGSTVNRSGRPRRTLYYCYSIGYMPDWGGQGLHYSDGFAERLSPERREVLRLK